MESPQAVLLGAGPYLTLDDTTFYTGTDLSVSYVNSRPSQRPSVRKYFSPFILSVASIADSPP